MKWKEIVRLSATMQAIISIFMLIPTFLAAYWSEWLAFKAFITTLLLMGVYISVILSFGKSWKAKNLSARDIYIFVTLTYISATALGALPLYAAGSTLDYTSAYMEIMSGFSTTGLTNLPNIEALPQSILFWRSMTHWLGGMGIVVLFVALLPLVGAEGVQLYGAEAVGPSKSRLTPKIKTTALILWLIYVGLTLIETVLLLLGGLSLFDATTVALSTVATGGFVTKNLSIGHYNSSYVDVVVTIFMVMGGINFSLYYAVIRRRFSIVKNDLELKVYLAIFTTATLVITITLIRWGIYPTFFTALRYASFHTASILTTTGFATANYNNWPILTQAVLLTLMFVGGSAGSTSGGIKVTRLITMFKLGRQNIRTMLHPKGYFTIQSENEPIPWRTVNAIAGFITIYLALVLASTLVVASAGYNLLTSFSAGLISVGNFGLGFNLIGPMGVGFAAMPNYVKWFLSLMMMAGRLEIYTVFAFLSRSFWRR
jgi:trk system potassium uptake protein TrkH